MFSNLDKAIFNLLDKLNKVEDISDSIENFLEKFDDEQQRLISQFVSVLFISFPIIIILIINSSNNKKQELIDNKIETLSMMNKYIADKNVIDKLSKKMISSTPINSMNDFYNITKNYLNSKSIPAESISVTNFDLPEKEGLKDILIAVKFKNMITTHIMEYLNFIENKTKAKFEKFEIVKNIDNNTLKGDFTLKVFQK